jgi:hypothetical protein
MKQCRRCGRTQTRDNFSRNRSEWDDLSRYCKPCCNTTQQRHLDKIRLKYRRYVQIPMLVAGCAWCGYHWNVEALHLDHLVPNNPDKFGGYKTMNEWVLGTNPLPHQIAAEMGKCQILCANCHAEQTWQQKQRGELRYRTANPAPTTTATDPQLHWPLEPTTTGPHDWQPDGVPATTTGGQP